MSFKKQDDPLTAALAPPENESPAEREQRLKFELDAKRRSDAIDDEIDKQRSADKKAPKPIQVLLLGQSESGKSTTLKNFQLMNSQKAFRAELPSWRAVIQLNIVRSIRVILDAMSEAQAQSPRAPSGLQPVYPPLTSALLNLKMRLSPLLQIEDSLTHKLTGSSPIRGETVDNPLTPLTNLDRNRSEVTVHSRSSWKSSFRKRKEASDQDDINIDWDDPNDPGRVIHACRDDMMALWSDPIVQLILKTANVRVEEIGGFYLDQLPRVTEERYVPTNDDILRARLKTVGVTEYRFQMKPSENGHIGSGITLGSDFRIFDVGGHRSLRAAWIPFFDDMNAIIFLAPISCFDQVLAEDSRVNRLEDSVQIWHSIVSNPLLADTPFVLFLNKCDILKAKLESGIEFSKYIVSYGDRPNDFENTSAYLKKKFSAIHKEKSRKPRAFHSHFTSVTDSNTASILRLVQDSVILKNLRQGGLLA